jgi:hypothetical protein
VTSYAAAVRAVVPWFGTQRIDKITLANPQSVIVGWAWTMNPKFAACRFAREVAIAEFEAYRMEMIDYRATFGVLQR